jgi:hypothetical protein
MGKKRGPERGSMAGIYSVNKQPRAASALHGGTRLGNHPGGALGLGGGLIMRLAVKVKMNATPHIKSFGLGGLFDRLAFSKDAGRVDICCNTDFVYSDSGQQFSIGKVLRHDQRQGSALAVMMRRAPMWHSDMI